MNSVVLLAPKVTFESAYPLELAALVPALRAQGLCPVGMDLCRVSLNFDAISSAQAVVIQTSIRNIAHVLRLAEQVSAYSTCPLIFISPAAALVPELFLNDVRSPCAAISEANCQKKGQISQSLIDVLQLAVLSPSRVDRLLFPPLPYAEHPLRRKGLRFAPISASRGCSYNCSFCVVPKSSPAGLRLRDPNEVVEELQMLRRDFGIQGIWFEDDQPIANRPWFEELLCRIRKSCPDSVLEFPNGLRPELLDRALLAEMARSGVSRIAVGIESGDDCLRESLGRCSDMGLIQEAICNAKSLGIVTTGYFMIGLPNESAAQLASTLYWARRLPLHHAHISVFWPSNPPILEATVAMRRLGAIRALGYLGIYASGRRQYELWRSGELSHAKIAISRMSNWIASSERGGGGW